jgi:two-component system, NarL family, sensor histidine kinase UhpB
MRSALQSQELDVITSDHAMPQFSAPADLAKEIRPAVPFIIVSGEMDLNLAVSLMRSGARDCIQKQELQLLIQTIERELREVALRRERKQVDETLRESRAILQAAMDHSPAGIAIADAPDGKLRYMNDVG